MSLEALLQRGLDEQVYLHAQLEVFHRGEHVRSVGHNADDLFDLASVTKVMSTTALVLDTRLPVEAPLTQFLPRAVARATLEDLLFHRSGLPAFQPYFAQEMLAHPELFDTLHPQPELRALVRRSVLERVAATPQERAPGVQSVYSDLGFILLGAALEASTGLPLDRLFAERIAAPLGLRASYRRISVGGPIPIYAPTGGTRPKEPAPGQEGLWNVPVHPAGPCEVDDDNAWCLDGVSGHAGLFGTALDVARFGQAVLAGRWAPRGGWVRDATPGSTRTFGFDTPSAEGASCGQRFGRGGPRGAIGHLGFTGTSLWIDLDRELVVAFLTNRVWWGRSNLRIRAFRPQVHDAVLDDLKLE